jgi:NADH dehydrogenase FAD-containing subunit
VVTNSNANVVVVGAGYAGLMAAMRLAKKTPRSVTITLVNESDTFIERVRNHQLLAGAQLPVRSLRKLVARTRIEVSVGRVDRIDPYERRVIVAADGRERSLPYDYLVYALGSHVDVDSVPGVREHAFTADAASARRLASELPAIAERGGSVLVVGGGNTGVEVSTELAESHPGLRITVVTRRSFARNLSGRAQQHIRAAFTRLGITFRENTQVLRLEAGRAITDTGSIAFDACVWVGGFAVSDVARRSGLRVNGRGQVIVDRSMRSVSHPDVYAAGDSAWPAEDPGTPVRMSLYAAGPMAAHAADSLAAHLRGRPSGPFGLSYIAQGVSLGRRDGVLQFLDPNTDSATRFVLTGRLANGFRDFFVAFLLLTIRLQPVAPWIFFWPGKSKMAPRVRVEGWPSMTAPSPGAR